VLTKSIPFLGCLEWRFVQLQFLQFIPRTFHLLISYHPPSFPKWCLLRSNQQMHCYFSEKNWRKETTCKTKSWRVNNIKMVFKQDRNVQTGLMWLRTGNEHKSTPTVLSSRQAVGVSARPLIHWVQQHKSSHFSLCNFLLSLLCLFQQTSNSFVFWVITRRKVV
jgi:hypothetical protein